MPANDKTTSQTARKRRLELTKGYPTVDRGTVPEGEMYPSALKRALFADSKGNITKRGKGK